eukprot:1048442-Amorphochlora_amoeboformis.AAC.1
MGGFVHIPHRMDRTFGRAYHQGNPYDLNHLIVFSLACYLTPYGAQSATAPSNSLPTSSQPKDVPRPKTTHPHAVPQSISAVGPPTSAHPLPIQEIPQVNAQVLWSSQYLSQATAAMKRQHPPMTEGEIPSTESNPSQPSELSTDMRRNVKRKLGDPSRAIGVVPVASSVGPNPTSLPSPSGAPGPTVGMQ